MNIENIHINKLINASYNPRILRDDRYNRAYNEMSSQQWEWLQPLVANKSHIENGKYTLVGGNQRFVIAKRLFEEGDKRFEYIPIIFVEIEDIKEEEKLNLKLNQHWGDWDFDALANLNIEIPELIDIGFDMKELSKGFDIDMKVMEQMAHGTKIEDMIQDNEKIDKEKKEVYNIKISFKNMEEFNNFRENLKEWIKDYPNAYYSISEG